MGDKFLLTKGTASSLSNGTTDIFASTLGAIGLNPSMPLKTNSFRQLVSTKLDISDINTLGSTLATLAQTTAGVQPPAGTVTDNGLVVFNGTTGELIKEETGYSIDTVNNKLIAADISTSTTTSLNTELQKIENFSASTQSPDITTITGELGVEKIKSYTQNCEIELDNNDMTLSADNEIILNANGGNGDLFLLATNTSLNNGAGDILLKSISTVPSNGINGDIDITASTGLNFFSNNSGDITLSSDRHVDILPNPSVTGEVRLGAERTILNSGQGDIIARSIISVANNTQNGDLDIASNRDVLVGGADIKLNATNEVLLNAPKTILNAGAGDLIASSITTAGSSSDMSVSGSAKLYLDAGTDIELTATNEVNINTRVTTFDAGNGILILSTLQNAGTTGDLAVSANDTLDLNGTDISLTPSGTGQVTCNQTPTSGTSIVNKDYADSLAPKTGTKSEMLALTGLVAGQQFYMNANAGTSFTSQENKMFVWSGRTWQVTGETIEMVCASDMIEGNTLEIGQGADYEVKKTVATESDKCIGVIALQAATSGDWVTVATRGLWEVACEAGTYGRSSYLQTDTIDGLARVTNSVSEQPFAKIVEDRTTTLNGTGIWALLHTQEIY